MVGSGLGDRGAGTAGLRVDRRGRAPAWFVRRGIQDDQRAGGAGCRRPVGDDARPAWGGSLRCPDRAGAEASRLNRSPHPDRRRYRRHAGRGEPGACRGGGSLAHGFWATSGFIALTAWPVASARRAPSAPYGLRPAVSAGAAAVMLVLFGWFGAELIAGLGQVGLAERILAETQALWPLAVVLTAVARPSGGWRRSSIRPDGRRVPRAWDATGHEGGG